MAVGQGGRRCVRSGSCTCLDACGRESSLVFTPYRPPRGGLKKMACGRQEAACATAGAGASTGPRSAVLSQVEPSLTWAALRERSGCRCLLHFLGGGKSAHLLAPAGSAAARPIHTGCGLTCTWSLCAGERLRCACRPWPCLLEEKGSLLAEQGDLRSSPPARPGCGLTCRTACAWHRRLQELCKAATPSQQ